MCDYITLHFKARVILRQQEVDKLTKTADEISA